MCGLQGRPNTQVEYEKVIPTANKQVFYDKQGVRAEVLVTE
jgi:hypothetical protein